MAASDIDICSQALAALGIPPIASFQDGPTGAVCGRIYNTSINALFAEFPWDFARSMIAMSRDVNAPAGLWLYSYQFPTDMVQPGVYAVYETSNTRQKPYKDYEVQGRKILTDSPTLFLVYTRRAPEGEWPPHFYRMAIHAVEVDIVMPLTEDPGRSTESYRRAYGTPAENRRGGYMKTATTRDSQSDPGPRVEDFTLINARLGG